MAVKKVVAQKKTDDDDMFSLGETSTPSKRYVPKAAAPGAMPKIGPSGPMGGPSGPMFGPSGPMGGPSGPLFEQPKTKKRK